MILTLGVQIICSGDDTMGVHLVTSEHVSWMYKLGYVLIAPEPGISVEEVMSALPTIEEMIPMLNAGFPYSWLASISTMNLIALAAEVCDKLGQHERALGETIPNHNCQLLRMLHVALTHM
jgi:hypothetical protein